MKQLALSLLFSAAFLINISGASITTNLGTIQVIIPNGASGSFESGTTNISGIINLGQSNFDVISIQGLGISRPSSGTNFLMINSSGNIVSTNSGTNNFNCASLVAAPANNQSITLGIPTKNYFNFTSNSGGVTLEANNINANLSLSANGHITLSSIDISTPPSGSSYLMINSSGQLISAGGGTSTFNCGNLVAAPDSGQSITIGIPANNYLHFTSDSGDITLQANTLNGNLSISANGHVTLSGKNIAPTGNGTGYSLLATDRSGNIISTNSSNIFKIGSDTTGNNYITIDNATLANGINLNSGALYLQGQNLSPAAGSTNILTIDSNGKIGIVLSAKAYKEDIKSIHKQISLDSIKPVSYKYKGSDRTEYGFLAEDLMHHEVLKDAVIFEPDGTTPMSINYQSVFVVFIADYLETKKELKALKRKVTTKDDKIEALQNKCTELESILKEITNKLNS
jgi:hypothetical protein